MLGDAWSPLILREAVYGARRFEDFQSGLGIARNTLATRLRRLVDEQLLDKHLYQTHPRRYEYRFTEKGADFFGVLAAMSAWGNRWMAGEQGPLSVFHHSDCGHDMAAVVVCEHCGVPLTLDNTSIRMGPGYPKRLKERADIQRRFNLDPA